MYGHKGYLHFLGLIMDDKSQSVQHHYHHLQHRHLVSEQNKVLFYFFNKHEVVYRKAQIGELSSVRNWKFFHLEMACFGVGEALSLIHI